MDANFWQEKWACRDIGFHQSAANPLLVKYFGRLSLVKDSRVFIPLCGKTRDIGWLLAQGFRVAGIELVESAVCELFAEMKVTPKIVQAGALKVYQADGLDIFMGNFFDLSRETLGPVDAVYDRAALVALPVEMRKRYAAHMKKITASAPQILIHYEYDQSKVAGPPFSIDEDELRSHYGDDYHLNWLEESALTNGMKGKCPACEKVLLLQKR